MTNLPAGSLFIASNGVKDTIALGSWAATLASPVLVFFFVRPTTAVHSRRVPDNAIANRSILQDYLTLIYTTFVASGIFSLVLYISYLTWLPAYLNVHFKGLSLVTAIKDNAHALPQLFATLILPGWMLRDFLFVSSTGAQQQAMSKPSQSLITTVYPYTWGALSAKTKVLVTRTILLAIMVVLTSVVQLVSMVKNVISIEGAAGWGALWGSATLLVGLMFAWIEGVEGL